MNETDLSDPGDVILLQTIADLAALCVPSTVQVLTTASVAAAEMSRMVTAGLLTLSALWCCPFSVGLFPSSCVGLGDDATRVRLMEDELETEPRLAT